MAPLLSPLLTATASDNESSSPNKKSKQMGLKETEAIILRAYNLAEADKIVVCLTRDAGVIRAVAKGARRLKSRFGAALEPSTVLALGYFEKEGKELVSLNHAEIIDSHFGLSHSAEIVLAFAYMSELIMEFSPPGEPNERVYRMVRAVFEALESAPSDLYAFIRYFEIWLLRLSGFFPDIRLCANCRSRLDVEGLIEFYVTDQGLCCGNCICRSKTRLSRKAYEHLLSARRLSPLAFGEALRNLESGQRAQIAALSELFIGRALERQPRSQLNHS